jgi:DNA invertase Pin-like site-specific DNA recombinase
VDHAIAQAYTLSQALLALVRERRGDALGAWITEAAASSIAALTRFAQGLQEDLVGTLHELQALGVGFISLQEALDFTTPTGRALAGLLSVFAEFERDILRERVKAGIAQARKRGTRHGRPPTVAHHAEAVRALAATGLSKSAIARRLAISRASVRRFLER